MAVNTEGIYNKDVRENRRDTIKEIEGNIYIDDREHRRDLL